MSVDENIRNLRISIGLSQTELARVLQGSVTDFLDSPDGPDNSGAGQDKMTT